MNAEGESYANVAVNTTWYSVVMVVLTPVVVLFGVVEVVGARVVVVVDVVVAARVVEVVGARVVVDVAVAARVVEVVGARVVVDVVVAARVVEVESKQPVLPYRGDREDSSLQLKQVKVWMGCAMV